MTDIVERLRARADRRDLSSIAYAADCSIDLAAADEVEKLRDALRRIAGYHPAVTHGWADDVRSIARTALGEDK